MKTSGWKPWAFRLSALLVAAALMLALAEMAYRRLFPFRPTVLRPHPVLLYEYIPGAQKVFFRKPVNGGARIPVAINRAGYRGPELETLTNRLRVVVYGDSMVAGEYSREENTFATRLQAHLGSAVTTGVDVINAGVNGYGPDQVALRLAHDLPKLKPDAVVQCVFVDNDYGDLVRNKLLRLDADGRSAWQPAQLSPPLAAEMRAAADPGAQRGLRLANAFRNFIRKVVKRVKNLKYKKYSHPRKDVNYSYVMESLDDCHAEYRDYQTNTTAVLNALVDHYDADLAVEPGTAASALKLRLMVAALRVSRDAAAAAGVPWLLVLVPSPIDLCTNYDYQVDAAIYPDYQRPRLSSVLVGLSSANKFPFVDLWPLFEQAGADALYFHGGDDHWNDRGQDLAADTVARRVLAEGWLAAPPAERAPP